MREALVCFAGLCRKTGYEKDYLMGRAHCLRQRLDRADWATLPPELKCCLTLMDCDRCNAVEHIPAGWQAKTVLVSNQCPVMEHIKVRYEGADGEIHITPWQNVAPRSDAYLKGDDGRPLVSYGASYGFKMYATSPEAPEAAPPVSLQFKNANVFNEIKAWRKDETRLNVKGCDG